MVEFVKTNDEDVPPLVTTGELLPKAVLSLFEDDHVSVIFGLPVVLNEEDLVPFKCFVDVIAFVVVPAVLPHVVEMFASGDQVNVPFETTEPVERKEPVPETLVAN
jgi:hypothetical protein